MVKYNQSIIYKLCCKDPSIPDIYIGSTTNFTRRKSSHKTICNKTNNKSFNTYVYQFIREHGNFDNWDMIEVERYEATDKKHLETRERYWIELLKTTLNKKIPTRTMKEWSIENSDKLKDYRKEWRIENADKLKEQMKEWSIENADKIKEYRKEYYEDNKDLILEKQKEYCIENADKCKERRKRYRIKNAGKIKELQKEWYIKNIDKIKERQKEKVQCDCGSIIRKNGLSGHYKTQKHLKNLKNK